VDPIRYDFFLDFLVYLPLDSTGERGLIYNKEENRVVHKCLFINLADSMPEMEPVPISDW
jgi:hypothetical protein